MNLNTQKEVMRAARPSLLKKIKNKKLALITSSQLLYIQWHDQTRHCFNRMPTLNPFFPVYKHSLVWKAPTWWGWEHRRCSGSWRWKVKPLRPPAQTGRCRCEPSSEPDVTTWKKYIYIRRKWITLNQQIFWISVFFVAISEATFNAIVLFFHLQTANSGVLDGWRYTSMTCTKCHLAFYEFLSIVALELVEHTPQSFAPSPHIPT